jgi:hypothetical protein
VVIVGEYLLFLEIVLELIHELGSLRLYIYLYRIGLMLQLLMIQTKIRAVKTRRWIKCIDTW